MHCIMNNGHLKKTGVKRKLPTTEERLECLLEIFLASYTCHLFSDLSNLFSLREGGNLTRCCAKQVVRALGHVPTRPQHPG